MRAAPVLGTYVVQDTPASRLDARVKILLLLCFTASVFVAARPLSLMAWYVLVALCLRASCVQVASVLRALKPAAVVLAFVLLANLVSCDGGAALHIVGPIGLSPAGALRGATAVLRIVLLVAAALVVAASTTSTELADAFVRLLSPLARFNVPVAAMGMALSVALRFVPITAEEFQRIRMAQQARGVRFDQGGPLERVRRWTAVFAPLIVGLLRRADALAEAMEARCYAGQVQVCPQRLTGRDWTVLLGGMGIMALVVVASVL